MMFRTVRSILVLSLLCSFGCDSSKTPLELPRYTILKSGDPNELPVQPKDSPYWLMISPFEKGHEVLVLPSGSGDVERFRSKRIRFWIEGDEVKVEVLEQGVIDVGETIADRREAPPSADNPPPIKGRIQIRFPEQRLRFALAEVAQGVTFKYEIVVSQDIEDVTPEAQDTGRAAGPGPSGLYPFESISGNGQSYSLHDIGLGPGVSISGWDLYAPGAPCWAGQDAKWGRTV
jgi:hypothetical protein